MAHQATAAHTASEGTRSVILIEESLTLKSPDDKKAFRRRREFALAKIRCLFLIKSHQFLCRSPMLDALGRIFPARILSSVLFSVNAVGV